MKKKLGVLFLALVLVAVCSLAFAACGEEEVFTVTLDFGYENKTQTATVSGSFTLPTLSREGYTFNGWKDASGKAAEGVVAITADATYTAQWTVNGTDTPVVNTIAIKYVYPADAEGAPSNTSVDAGATVTLPQGPEVDGKQFVGWQSQEGAMYQAGGVITTNPMATQYTFTAVYNTMVTVRYNTPAGTTAPAAQTVQEGAFVALAAAPAVAGKVFSGWTIGEKTYAEGQCVPAAATTGSTMVIAATYKNIVTAKFMIGPQVVDSIECVDGDTITLPDYASTASKVFKGWLQAGQQDLLAAGAKVTMTDANIAFEAQFADAVAVNFYDETGLSVVETQWVEVGSDAAMPAYEYPASYGGWWMTFDGLDASLEKITESVDIHPVYSYVPTEDTNGNLYEFKASGDGYQVAFKGYANGMGEYALTELKLPYEHEGKPVTGIYTTQTTVYTVADTQYKKGGFALSSKLERLYIPASFTELGVYAFAQDTALTEVVFAEDSQLATISKGAFAQCIALESITIPASVTLIDEKAFTECVSLAEVKFEEGGEPLTFGNNAFSYFGGTSISATTNMLSEQPAALKSFEFPARTTKIGQHMFRFNVWFEELTFEQPTGTPISLTIDQYAFAGAGTVNASSGQTGAYPYSKKLTTLTIPARTESIGNGAFGSQFFVEELIFEDGFNPTTIGTYVFANMFSLKSLQLSQSMETIGQGMFAAYKWLPTASSGATYYEDGVRPASLVTSHSGEFGFNTDCLTTVIIPNGVKTISTNAFADRSEISTLQIANSVETIQNTAFGTTMTRNIYNSNSVEIVLPYNLKTLGGSAFNGWLNITKVVINCPYLETLDSAFNNDTNPNKMCGKDVVFVNIDSLTTIKGSFKNVAYLKSVTFESEPVNELTITDSFNDKSGLSTSTISNLVLPANVASISKSFQFLKNLTEIKFASANEHYSFEYGGLYYIDGAEKTIVAYLYSSSPEVVIAEGTTVIDADVFKGGGSTDKRILNSVTIPSTVRLIGSGAFQFTTLSQIVIPDTVEIIEKNAFATSNLTSVVCGAKIIKELAFESCTSLETIVLTSNVRDIAVNTFNSLGNTSCKLSYVKLEGNAVKNLVQGFTSCVTTPIFNSTAKTFKIWVDSSDLINQYTANNIWMLADISDLFVAQTLNIVFGDDTLTVPAGSKLNASQVPSDESGYVWITSDNKEIAAGATVTSGMTLAKAYKITIADSAPVYVSVGGTFAQVEGKTFFDENGQAFDHTKPVDHSMTLTEGEAVTVTFGTEVVSLMKGATLSADSIPSGVWCVVENDVSSAFDLTAPVTEDVTLYQAIEIVVFGTDGSRMSFWVKAGTKASAELLETVVYNTDNQRVTKDLAIVDLAEITFEQPETYVVRASSKLTFHLSDTETKEVWVINSVDITSVIPELPANFIWGKPAGGTHSAIGKTVSGHTEYYRYIRFTVFVSKEAAANDQQRYAGNHILITENGKKVYYARYDSDISLPALKEGYGFFDENGVQYTAEQLAKANIVGYFTAQKVETSTSGSGAQA